MPLFPIMAAGASGRLPCGLARGGPRLHGFDLGATDARASRFSIRCTTFTYLRCQDLAQRPPIHPGPGGAFAGDRADQPIEILASGSAQMMGAFECPTHLPAEGQDQGLKEQGEAGKPAHEGGFGLAHVPVGKLHARNAHLEEALVLEEVQMTVAFDRGVMDGALSGHPRHPKPCTGLKVHDNRQRSGLRIKGHIAHKPGGLNSQGRLEQLRFRHYHHSSSGSLAVFYP